MTKGIIGVIMAMIIMIVILFVGMNVVQTQIDADTVHDTDELAATQESMTDMTVMTFDVLSYLPLALGVIALFMALMLFGVVKR